MIGKYPARMDDKNRLFVPAKLREALGQTFYVTVGVNCGRNCLTVYTAEGWRRVCEKFEELPIALQAGPTSLIFTNAVECNPDKQFRFSLSPSLLEYAGINREVMIVGRAGQAQIWDAQRYADFERDMLTPENLLASLEAIRL